jgi:4-amino-4-deoxy-L-arabinose transferase-like glycosyltransferase
MSTDVLTAARPVWHHAVASFLPTHTRSRADAWIQRLPLGVILAVQTMFMLRQWNTAFQDEGLYIDAGHDYIAHLLHGTPVPNYGDYFSGVPGFYPVLAALFDSVGGLLLVRAFSAVCMLAATCCVYTTARRLWSKRGGLVAALLFALNGSVLFVGTLATYDALCVVGIAVAAMLAATGRSYSSAVLAGLGLTVAVVAKYAGVAFVPVVMGLALATTQPTRRGLKRGLVIGLVPAGIFVGILALWGSSLKNGIEFTTTSRQALGWKSYPNLLGVVALDSGLLIVLALGGALLMVRSWRSGLIAAVLLAAAAVLPAAQIRIHEYVSLDKHMAYAALFLSVLGGRSLANVSLRHLRVVAAVVLVWLLVLNGLWRSDGFFHGWPNVGGVVAAVKENPKPGTYLSFEADAFRYYTKTSDPSIKWEVAYALFDTGSQETATRNIAAAVSSGRYEGYVYRSEAAGMSAKDTELQQLLQRALETSTTVRYRLVASLRVEKYRSGNWYVWQKVGSG